MFSRKDSKKIQEKLIATGTMIDLIEHLKKFNIKVLKRKVAHDSPITRLEWSRFGDVLTRKSDPSPIIKMRCTKPKTERMLIVYIPRCDEKSKAVGQYT